MKDKTNECAEKKEYNRPMLDINKENEKKVRERELGLNDVESVNDEKGVFMSRKSHSSGQKSQNNECT